MHVLHMVLKPDAASEQLYHEKLRDSLDLMPSPKGLTSSTRVPRSRVDAGSVPGGPSGGDS
eukprot:6937106-Prymnesium_polylepis.1